MKLTPHQILQKLGFDIPADGVEIHPSDAFVLCETLRLTGATIDGSRIPDVELDSLYAGMAAIVAATRGVAVAPAAESATDTTREAIRTALSLTFGRRGR